MPILVVLCLEECIAQRDRLNTLHIRIRHKLGINVEKHRHIDRLTRIQPLLLKTKALDLAKVGRNLARCHGVGGHADNVLRGLVRRRVKGQGRLARQHAHLALLRYKLPGKHVRHGAVECDADARVVGHGLQTLGGVNARVAAVGRRLDGLASPACLLADLEPCLALENVKSRLGIDTILYMGTEPYVIATKPTITLNT